MSREVKRYRIAGELKKIVDEIKSDRDRFMTESQKIADKYGFESFAHNQAEFASGMKLIGFANPSTLAKIELFKKPNKNGIYLHYVKYKSITKDIESVKPWVLKPLWDKIEKQPCPFEGNIGLYNDDKLDNEMLFFSYNPNFKGHEDLKELKTSEYYALIGE